VLLKPLQQVPFTATDYPISVAEMPTASKKLDKLLSENERAKMTDCLAFEPDVGEPLLGGSGIRKFEFESEENNCTLSIAYFFHDLNIPLFIIAVQKGEMQIPLSTREEETLMKLSRGIIHEYRKTKLDHGKISKESA